MYLDIYTKTKLKLKRKLRNFNTSAGDAADISFNL